MAGKSGDGVPLSVVAHMVANAQIEITLDKNGIFLDAVEIKKEDAKTLIPVTESSAGRASGIAPHPLSDTLSYIAGDYSVYASTEKEKKKSEDKFRAYMEALTKWRNSSYPHPKLEAIYSYIEKKRMIHDLITCGIIHLKENERFADSKVSGQPYEKAMIRFVIMSGDNENSPRTWEDGTLMDCYTNYYLASQNGMKDICYLKGIKCAISTNHPKGIVSSNYGAKLISANDTSNFVFRGRFQNAREASTISYEATQKAHNALTWLIAQQGVSIGNKDKRTYICWNPGGKKIPNLDNPFEFDDDSEVVSNTEPEYKARLRDTLNGYANRLQNNDNIVIMGLDAATTGRLSITYFNELKASDYLKRLEQWGSSCNWYFTEFTKAKKPYDTVKTPTVRQIVTYAYGTEQGNFIEVNDKILKEQSQRVYYCMLDAQPIPRDLLHSIVIKASTPLAYTYGNHEKVLATACALIAKYYNDREGGSIKMELDTKNQDRSYLFGRLLAIAEKLEKSTYQGEEGRATNAIRLQAAFVNHPMRTWAVLENALIPYYQKVTPATAEFFKRQVEDIFALLQMNDLTMLNKSLEEQYLIGYYAQRKALRFDSRNNNNVVEEEK